MKNVNFNFGVGTVGRQGISSESQKNACNKGRWDLRSPPSVKSKLLQKLRYWHVTLNKKVAVFPWFPHLPLALAVGLLGLVQFVPAIEQILGQTMFSEEIGKAGQTLQLTMIRGVPQGVLGLLLLVMSIGLAMRSRLAWLLTVIITTATLIFAFITPAKTISPWMIGYNAPVLFFILLFYRRFDRSSLTTDSLFGFSLVIMLFAYAILGSFVFGPDFKPPIQDFLTAVYYSLVTMSTVGYGDIVPVTEEARVFAVSLIIFGIIVFATSVSAILIPLINKRMQRLFFQPKGGKMLRSNHYIIVGATPLAHSAYEELTKRSLEVTVILPGGQSFPQGFSPKDYVEGDASDLEVLKDAGALQAKALLALREEDSENAFVVMAAKELGMKGKTICLVNQVKNKNRIERIHPDVLWVPQLLGGEILAMLLTGENIDGSRILQQVLVQKDVG